MRRFLRRLWNVIRPHQAERDLMREISAHLTLLQDEYERRGMSAAEAYRAARIALGGVEQTKELHRDARAFRWLNDARQDVAYAIRSFRRSPLFTLTAAISLSIGIGANAAVFTVANALLLRAPDGIADPRALVDIGTRRGDGGLNPMPYATFLEVSRRATTLSGVFAQHMFPRVMSLGGSKTTTAERVFAHHVTTEFFTVLRVQPAAGRLFDSGDGDARRASAVAVLSHAFWGRRFGHDPSAVGQAIRINGRPFTVVGVAAPGFQGTGVMDPDLWLPLSADENRASVLAGGRLNAGVTAAQAAAELAAIGDSIDREPGLERQRQPVHVMPSSRAGANRNLVIGFAGVLMMIVSIVLAVACANVAAIILTRSTARSKELALRTALGARRGRLLRQLLTETVILFLLGGLFGLALACALILLTRFLPSLPMPVSIPLTLDWRVMAFTMSLSLSAALLSGLAPAFKGSKVDPLTALKDDSSSSPRGARLRGALVVSQVALSVLLVVTAGLLVRALRHAGAANPGFDARGVDIALLDLSTTDYTDSARLQFWRNLIDEVRQMPDVETATLARVAPGGFEGIGLGTVAATRTLPLDAPFIPAWNIVDAGYFATLRIPLVAGRDFSDRDTAGAPPVAIVGEGIARRFWPGRSAIGEYLAITNMDREGSSCTREVLVIGIAGDVKSSSLIDGLAGSYMYLPLQQSASSSTSLMTTQMTILARTREGHRLHTELTSLVRKLNPTLAIARSETVEDSIALGLAPQQLLTTVTGSLGLVGMGLAALGIYGVTAYSVARRRRELGIRMALGAQQRELVVLVLRDGLRLTALGAIIGLALATGASHVVSAFLYGLPALHLPTFFGTAILFALVGLTACYIPARRAVGIEPLQTLRYE